MTSPGQLGGGADFLAGLWQIAPVAVSAGLYALLLGALAAQKGLSPLEVAVMSGLVFAGASQFVAVELWGAPLAAGTIVLATLVVNFRHTLMGAAIAPALAPLGPGRAYLALFFLVDEAWALAMRRMADERLTLAFYAGLAIPLYLAWIAATTAGAALGRFVADPARYGLDVVFAAVFIVLLTGFWQGKRSLVPWGASAAGALASHFLVPGAWHIFIGATAGALAAALLWRPGDDG